MYSNFGFNLSDEKSSDSEDKEKSGSELKVGNLRRNIREVMDETKLDEATLAAQMQEKERLRRVQEQLRANRDVTIIHYTCWAVFTTGSCPGRQICSQKALVPNLAF